MPVEDPGQLETGFYAIREPDTGQYLYRSRAEDLSMRPKAVALQPGDLDQCPLILRVSR